MSTASKEDLEELHSVIAKELTSRINSGKASAADISNAIKFLKDNGIEALPDRNPDIGGLAEQFPFPTAEDGKVLQ